MAHPTELELLILKILWDSKEPLQVRDVRERLEAGGRALAHTTVITTLNTMFDKKYVKRKKSGNAFLFSHRIAQPDVSNTMLKDLFTRVFDGSAKALVLNLMEQNQIDTSELQELRRLLDQKIKDQKT
jgi:predicted transcriptional regulator